jgi:hypothetical protein
MKQYSFSLQKKKKGRKNQILSSKNDKHYVPTVSFNETHQLHIISTQLL